MLLHMAHVLTHQPPHQMFPHECSLLLRSSHEESDLPAILSPYRTAQALRDLQNLHHEDHEGGEGDQLDTLLLERGDLAPHPPLPCPKCLKCLHMRELCQPAVQDHQLLLYPAVVAFRNARCGVMAMCRLRLWGFEATDIKTARSHKDERDRTEGTKRGEATESQAVRACTVHPQLFHVGAHIAYALEQPREGLLLPNHFSVSLRGRVPRNMFWFLESRRDEKWCALMRVGEK